MLNILSYVTLIKIQMVIYQAANNKTLQTLATLNKALTAKNFLILTPAMHSKYLIEDLSCSCQPSGQLVRASSFPFRPAFYLSRYLSSDLSPPRDCEKKVIRASLTFDPGEDSAVDLGS